MKNSTLVKKYILGENSISHLEEFLSEHRIYKDSYIVFCIDHFFESHRLIESLPINSNDMTLFIDTTDEPRAEYIDELVDMIKKDNKSLPKVIVGIGGGSTLDIAKAISVDILTLL